MITIIFALPRFGKTVLMTHLLNVIAFDRERYKLMLSEINLKNASGFNFSAPKHCVAANYDIKLRKFGYRRKMSYRINPFRLGYANSKVKTHFVAPYMAIGITEGQKYFNSRMSLYYPDWQSRWMEQHGHNFLDIFIDVQRPGLIDVNIRELATFIEVIKLHKITDENGLIKTLKWDLRLIEDSYNLDKYLASGKKDTSCYKETTITANYNVFNCYNSRMCKPKFYEGHLKSDFDLQEGYMFGETFEEYVYYLENFDDEMPKGFYEKRSDKDGVYKK